jgi:hypothetical protein
MLTVVFPVAFYVLFTRVLTGGARLGNDERAFLMVSMAAYGAIGATLSAAVRVAMERTNGWTRQLRVTPLPALGYVTTKLVTAYLAAIPAILLVMLAAMTVNQVALPPTTWLATLVALSLGVLPFAALGVAIGYVFDESTAQLVFTVSFVGLSVLGGLWTPISTFPGRPRYDRPDAAIVPLREPRLVGSRRPGSGRRRCPRTAGVRACVCRDRRVALSGSVSSRHVADQFENRNRLAAGGASPADGPPSAAGAGDDRRGLVALLFRSAWLVFVAYPIVVLIADRPDPIEVILVVAGVGLFVGLLALASRTPDNPARATWIGPAIVLLLLDRRHGSRAARPRQRFLSVLFLCVDRSERAAAASESSRADGRLRDPGWTRHLDGKP